MNHARHGSYPQGAEMFRRVRTIFIGFVAGLAAALWLWRAGAHRPPRHPPDPPSLIEKVREVARLETLDVTLYKKVDFEPDPEPPSSLPAQIAQWASWTASPPHGKAIVFADVHVGFDLAHLDASSIRSEGRVIWMVLPPTVTTVEMKPGDTEVVSSNLDSAGTAKLLEKAKWEIATDVEKDGTLQLRARDSAERALRAVFLSTGYREVRFVDALPGVPTG